MKQLFALGLLLQLLAQAMFSMHSETFNLLEPIDFIHFTLLIGNVLIIPYLFVLSKGLFRTIGSTFTLIGATTNIGMCAIDLVLWSLRDDWEQRTALVNRLIGEPSIWPVFFSVGPAFLMVGLSVQALGYVRTNAAASIVTVVGAILNGVGGLILTEYRSIYMVGYVLFVAGLLAIVFNVKREQMQPQA